MREGILLFALKTGIISQMDFIRQLPAEIGDTVTTKKDVTYYNTPVAFDIETTSFMENDEKRAIMYVWQFEFNTIVTTGRTWDEFFQLLMQISDILSLSENKRIVIYVHNLAFEFQFMREWIHWDEVFSTEKNNPIFARYGGIEFKDSLILSGGLSLKKIGENLIKYPIRKMDGDLDYSLIRNSVTPLTEKEWKYCENDVRVLSAYIQEKIETDGDITSIPLTNTGYVRRFHEGQLLS